MVREGRTSERAMPWAEEINGLGDFPKDKNRVQYWNILYLQGREPSHESEFSECSRLVTASPNLLIAEYECSPYSCSIRRTTLVGTEDLLFSSQGFRGFGDLLSDLNYQVGDIWRWGF